MAHDSSVPDLAAVDALWRAANYLSVGQIYLYDNPLLKLPLERAHIKRRLLGHWGTTPGLNFIYAHMNRVILARAADVIFITGPGHGGPGIVANTWLERHVQRVVSGCLDGRGRHAASVPAVLVPGRHSKPCRGRSAWLDPRRWRARLLAGACLRRGVRPSPHANGGTLLRDLRLPAFSEYAVDVKEPGATVAEATRVQGNLIRDVIRDNEHPFRVFSPDETASNRWSAVFEITDRMLMGRIEDPEFDALFTRDKPIVFAFHGYPWLIHRLAYKRTNHHNLHVRGYIEEGTTTTPFDMTVLNGLDRFHLVMDVIERVPRLEPRAANLLQAMREKLIQHRQYVNKYDDDMPEIKNWKWGAGGAQRREERKGGTEQE